MNTVSWPDDGYGLYGGPAAIPGAHTFACPHMSIGNVVAASCSVCGPLAAAA